MWINISFLKKFISQIWQTFKCSGTVFSNLPWYRRTKDLGPLFDPTVHLFENSLLKMLAQLHYFAEPSFYSYNHKSVRKDSFDSIGFTSLVLKMVAVLKMVGMHCTKLMSFLLNCAENCCFSAQKTYILFINMNAVKCG